jgi:hypothetical protein
MITVTEETKRFFRVVAKDGLPEGKVLRLEAIDQGKNGKRAFPGFRVGEPKESDRPVWDQGEIVLYVSDALSDAYDGCVLDLEQLHDGLRCMLGPPDAGRNARS